MRRPVFRLPKIRSFCPPPRCLRGFVVAQLLFSACSFSYDTTVLTDESERPDITMNSVEYVRVRDGEPIVRIQADKAERYEKDQVMIVDSLAFAQYGKKSQEADSASAVGAVGAAGASRVDLVSGDVDLYGGVQIVIEQEDLEIDTLALSWRNDERILLGGDDIPVSITRGDGSSVSGTGFGVSARERAFEFTGSVSGVYVDAETKDDEKPAENEGGSASEAPSDSYTTSPSGAAVSVAEDEPLGEAADPLIEENIDTESEPAELDTPIEAPLRAPPPENEVVLEELSP